ncbi:hypothetical protein A5647_24790 [Mycobacterium sp. 1100029.7]|nr:hypothetical protein A5647_24790 [Mycobacterium sp. 1100029.7]
MDAVERVRIEDDGHGIAPEEVARAFEHLGGSWKATAKFSPNIKRRLQGSNGQGRLRGFALGNSISWTTTAVDTTGKRRRTLISGHASDPTDFDAVDSPIVGEESTGTVFVAEDPARYANRITSDSARPRITAAFALFLTTNPTVTIRFDGADLDPKAAERHRADYPIDGFTQDGNDPPILRIIEWSDDHGRAIHLCDTSGSVLETVSPDIHTPGFHYTAYVLWDEFAKQNAQDELRLAELQAGVFADVIASVREQIKLHFRKRESDRRAEQIAMWKATGDYPYQGDPATEVERAERETFDYVATTVARKIPKSRMGRRTTLGLLKVAVASEPSSLPKILDDLMPLPKREHENLARLLERTSLSKLIEANTTIATRLDFLTALREMVFETETKRLVRERSELHKILEKELWVFGEDYTMLTSDKGLDEVLARHIEVLRPDTKDSPQAGPVRRADGSRGIIDLMLSRHRRVLKGREHLVVELKRPGVPITQKEVAQLKSYADAVAADSQFNAVNVQWDFWVISSELDRTVTRDANRVNQPPGQVTEWENIRLWAKTWSQLIDDAETRLRHYREALEYDASREHAVDYINRVHEAETVPVPLRRAT